MSLCVSFVSADYFRRDVLPAEQYAASDLPCLLHPHSHLLKALMDREALQSHQWRFAQQKQNCVVKLDFLLCFLGEGVKMEI